MESKKVFFSQIGEDVLIYNNFINKYREDGTYVEIGGSDGVELSNSKFFHDNLGFRGLLVEPVPHFFNQLKVNRPNDVCVNCAVDYKEGVQKFLGHSHVAGIENYLSPILKDKYLKNANTWYIRTYPMSKVISHAGLKYIDYFSIDVEGAELAILETIDWSIPIYLITIELNEKVTENDKNGLIKNEKCRDILRKNGFRFLKQIDINEFWINDNYFRKDLLYDKNVKQFKTLREAGLFKSIGNHVVKDIQDNLNMRNI